MQIGYKHPSGKPPTNLAIATRVGVLLFACLGLIGMIVILSKMAGPAIPEDWLPEGLRRNFVPVLSTEEQDAAFEKARGEYLKGTPFANLPLPANQPQPKRDLPLPPPDGGKEKPPDVPPPVPTPGADAWSERNSEEAALLKEFRRERWLDPIEEFGKMTDYQPIRDWHPDFRGPVMSEFQANKGRQAPPFEQLTFTLFKRIPAPGDADLAAWQAKTEKDAYFFGLCQDFIAGTRGRVFEAEGRLFDLYEVQCEPAVVLPDGSRVERYFEGVVAFNRPGKLKREFGIEPQAVLFQTPDLPKELEPLLGAPGGVSHDDKLVAQNVHVKLTGMYLRCFPYSREVKPFSGKEKVSSQAWCPLLLTRDVSIVADAPAPTVTDPLLQQVKDSLRDDPRYLVDEAAYYVLLARSMQPGDELKATPKVGYFDLSGAETGPRYRGEGIGVHGMIGDNYSPVILPPNISGLRRVFRAYVVADAMDIKSPNRYLVDMIEPPTGLEARATVTFVGRYYRNVYEAESTSLPVRPLLIARQVKRFSTKDSSQDWIFMAVILGGALVVVVVLGLAMLGDKRERQRFEAHHMAMARERLERSGGLKLKPLPKNEPPAGGSPPAPPPG